MSRIAVVGVGAVGAVVAAALEEAGRHDVVLCARRERPAPTVELDGGREHRLAAAVWTDPGRLTEPVDVVVLAVKAHQTGGALPWLRHLRSATTPVLVLQNGVEHAERLGAAVPPELVWPGIVWCTAEEVAPGRVVVRPGERRIEIPAGPGAAALAAGFGGSFLEIRPVPDFTTAAWVKLTYNAVVALEALTCRRAEVFADPGIRRLAQELADECARVATAAGAALPAGFAERVVAELGALPPEHGTSILYDRLAGRAMEWDARNAVISRIGAEHGIATPVSDVIVPLLAASGRVPAHPEARR